MLDVEAIFKEHYSYLCRLSYSMVRDMDDAQDIAQSAFLKIWDRQKELNIQKGIKSYLSQAVINASLDFLSRQKLRRDSPMRLNDQNSLGTDQKFELNELEVRLEQALKNLPERCWVIFSLSRFEAKSSQEIAEHLNLSKKTVDNQIGIALKKLREELSDYFTLHSFPSGVIKNIIQIISRL